MAKRGPPLGNQNAASGRLFTNALRARLAKNNGKALRTIVAKMEALAQAGDTHMIREVIDRVDGKAMQAIEVSGSADLGVIVVPGKGK